MYSAIGAIKFPIWVKIERKGNQLTGYYSEDGVTWTANTNTGGGGASPNPQTIAMGDSVYIGLCVTSNNLGTPGRRGAFGCDDRGDRHGRLDDRGHRRGQSGQRCG